MSSSSSRVLFRTIAEDFDVVAVTLALLVLLCTTRAEDADRVGTTNGASTGVFAVFEIGADTALTGLAVLLVVFFPLGGTNADASNNGSSVTPGVNAANGSLMLFVKCERAKQSPALRSQCDHKEWEIIANKVGSLLYELAE
jgi:hypothetical protein